MKYEIIKIDIVELIEKRKKYDNNFFNVIRGNKIIKKCYY